MFCFFDESNIWKLEKLQKSRKPSDKRAKLLSDLAELESKHEQLAVELKKYADNDPAMVRAMGM